MGCLSGGRKGLHLVSQTGVGWQHTGPQQPEGPQQLDPQQLPQQLPQPPQPPQPPPPPQPDPQQEDPQQLPPQPPQPEPQPQQEPQQEPQQPQQDGWQQHTSQQSCSSAQQAKQSPGQHPMVPAGQVAGQDRDQSSPSLMVANPTAAFISPPGGCWHEGQDVVFVIIVFVIIYASSHKNVSLAACLFSSPECLNS